MFSNDMAESRTGKVYIPDIPSNIFEILLYFMYTGSLEGSSYVNLCQEERNVLLATADQYQVETLTQVVANKFFL